MPTPTPPESSSPPSAPPPSASPPSTSPPLRPISDARGYWRANLRLILVLLVVWALVSYVCGILLVETLNQVTLGKVPLGFWFAQQGSIYVFVVLIFIYAWRMDRLDARFGVSE